MAACPPKPHEPFFPRACLLCDLNQYLLEMVNLRNQDTWVHKNNPEEAYQKGLDLIKMGVDKARLLCRSRRSPRSTIAAFALMGLGLDAMHVVRTTLYLKGQTQPWRVGTGARATSGTGKRPQAVALSVGLTRHF